MIDVTITPELIGYLQADALLNSLAPDDVWDNTAPANRDALFIVVIYETAEDETCGGGSRITRFYYVAKVVGPAAMIATIRLAALRLDTLLHFGPLVQQHLPGYNVMTAKRLEPIAYSDPEPSTGVRYEHRGGRYQLQVEAV